MKIFSCTLALACFISINSLAQLKQSLQLSIGASQPIGAFGKTGVGTVIDAHGYAGTGAFINLLYKKKLNESPLSVAAMLDGNINFLKTGNLVNNYKQNNPGYNIKKTSSSNWVSVALMPGLCYSTPGAVSFHAGIFAGAAWAHLAGFVIEGESASSITPNQFRSEQEDKSVITFNGRITAGLQFKAGKKSTLAVTAAYNYLRPTFKQAVQTYYSVTTTQSNPLPQYMSSRRQFDYPQSMHSISLGIGMLWVL